MSNKNILVVSPFFYPEIISTGKFNTDLVLELVKDGNQVTVLCFHPFYPDWKTKKSLDVLENITIVRGGENIKYSKKTFLRRVILEVAFAFFVLRKVIKHQKNKDIIIPVFPPSFAFYLSLFFLKKEIKKVGMVHDLQEVYSSNKKGFMNKIIRFFIHKVEKKCYSNCNKLIFLSNEMKEEAKHLYDLEEQKLEVQYPFINLTGKNSNSLEPILSSEINNIVYSGALGEKQNPLGLYDFFNFASTKMINTEFHFFSQGSVYEMLKNKNKNKKIKFHNLVHKNHLEELYKRSTIQIVPQAPNTSKGSLPSKLPNLLASGCKVLVITDKNSELQQLFKMYKLEMITNSWQKEKLLECLNNLLKTTHNQEFQKKVAKKLFTIQEMIYKVLA